MLHVLKEKDQFPVCAKLRTLSKSNRTLSINMNLQHLLHVLSVGETGHLNAAEGEQNPDLKNGNYFPLFFFLLDRGAL